MDVKCLVLSLAALAMAGCSEDGGLGNSSNNPTSGTGGEIQLVFGGNDQSTDYTKAIATDAENQIDNLDVYVFASATASGTYFFQEKWSSAATNNAVAKAFALQGVGTSRKASVFPAEIKDFPYLKLYCIANHTKLYTNGVDEAAALTAITPTGVTAGATPATDFEAYTVASLTATTSTMKPALAMVGQGNTYVRGSLATVEVELKRLVARFDIDNTAATSGLSITSVTINNGRPRAKFFTPAAALGEPGELVAADLINYQASPFTPLANANQGVTESVLYTYPSLIADDAYLIINGLYFNKETKVETEVHYPVLFTKSTEAKRDTINIEANHRYTLHITDVLEGSINAYFEVKDWTTGGGVIIKPENAAPEILAITGDGVTVDEPTGLLVLDRLIGNFYITASATSAVEMVIPAGFPWLIARTDSVRQIDGKVISYLSFNYMNARGECPSIILRNGAGSADPSVEKVVTIAPLMAHPVVTLNDKFLSTYTPADTTISLDVRDNSNVLISTLAYLGVDASIVYEGNGTPWLDLQENKKVRSVFKTYTLNVLSTVNVYAKAILKLKNKLNKEEYSVNIEPIYTLPIFGADYVVTPPNTIDTIAKTMTVYKDMTGVLMELPISASGGLVFEGLPDWLTISESSVTSGSIFKLKLGDAAASQITNQSASIIVRNRLDNAKSFTIAATLDVTPVYEGTEAVLVSGIWWAPFNVGATKVATAVFKSGAYPIEQCGYLFQWGRNKAFNYSATDDKVVGPIAYTTIATGQVNENKFIHGGSEETKYDWLLLNDASFETRNNLWNVTNNSPCPMGWRVPMGDELGEIMKLIVLGKTVDANGVLSVPSDKEGRNLFLPKGGCRDAVTGNCGGQGDNGNYWSSSFNPLTGQAIWINFIDKLEERTSFGFSLRCVKV